MTKKTRRITDGGRSSSGGRVVGEAAEARNSSPDAAIFQELAEAGGRPLSSYLIGLLDMWLKSEPLPKNLPAMDGRQVAAHWRRISGLAAELIEAVEGPKGRRLAATYTLRATIDNQSKMKSIKTLGCDVSESPLWWDAVRELLAAIAAGATFQADRQSQESALRGKGGDATVDISDECFAMIYALAGEEALERGEHPPDDYQNFRRALAKHLPSHLLANVTPESFAQRPKRREKRLRHRE